MPRKPAAPARVTLLDVARAAGVSRATASLVIRQSPLVAAATRTKVEAAMQALGYVYNRGAATLRAGAGGFVGLVIPTLRNPFYAEFIAGVEAALDATDRVLLLGVSNDDPARQARLLRRMVEDGVEGMLVCPAEGTGAEELGPLPGSGPMVQTLRHVTPALDYIGPDYGAGMALAVDHLVGLGHRRIAFLAQGRSHSAARERREGLDRALAAQGLGPCTPVLLPAETADMARLAAERFLALGPATSAAICFNDVLAFALIGGLIDAGRRPGVDVSVIGFDHVLPSEVLRPRLTSVATHPEAVGFAAAERLVARLGTPELPVLRARVPSSLALHDTTQALPG